MQTAGKDPLTAGKQTGVMHMSPVGKGKSSGCCLYRWFESSHVHFRFMPENKNKKRLPESGKR